MLADDLDKDPGSLEPEVRPRFQSEYEAWQEGISSEGDPAAAAEEAGGAKKKGRAARGGKWQVSDLLWRACQLAFKKLMLLSLIGMHLHAHQLALEQSRRRMAMARLGLDLLEESA